MRGRLRGCEVNFEKVTVTGTENLMMAATLARGKTTIHNAAREPEIADLAELLNKMGARVRGAGTATIQVEGVAALGSAEHSIIPDRIETGTFIAAGAITNGELEIKDCRPEHLSAVISKLREVGVEIEEVNQSTLYVRCSERGLKASDLGTEPYPGFPTDMQAQFMTLMTQAQGRSIITETIFENRFMHASELQRMGARIQISRDQAIVDGRSEEHTSELQSRENLVCRLLLEKKKKNTISSKSGHASESASPAIPSPWARIASLYVATQRNAANATTCGESATRRLC